jgi:hypothetical protein
MRSSDGEQTLNTALPPTSRSDLAGLAHRSRRWLRELQEVCGPALGKCGEGLARLGGLQSFRELRALRKNLRFRFRISRLVEETAPAGCFARRTASALASLSSLSSGTTLLARPQASAEAASTASPSANIS